MISSYITMPITITFLLSAIFGYFFIIQKENFIGIWSVAWLISACGQCIVYMLQIENANNYALVLNEIFIILCAMLFGLGTYYFTEQRPPWWWGIIFVLDILWSIISISYSFHYIIRVTPIILLILYVYTKIGMVFFRNKDEKCFSNIILGIAFFCRGLMLIAFVVLVNLTEVIYLFSPWLYLLNSIIAIIMAVSILDIHYGKQMSRLKISENLYSDAIQDIKDSEEHHRKIIELLPDALFIHKEKEPLMANLAALRLMKCENREVNNQLYFNIHPDYKQKASERLIKLTTSETTVEFVEEKFILHNGDMIDVEVGGVSYLHKGEMYIVSIVRDISERKKVEKLQLLVKEKDKQLAEADEYDKSKTEFFTTISHELKTPINIILGSIQLYSQLHTNYEGCSHYNSCLKYLKMMKQNCYRLLKLSNNLIDITRFDSGTVNKNFMSFNIVSIVENITLSVVEFAKNLGIDLIFDTDIEEKIIYCDADKIERVILNLISNAIKFTEREGTIEVRIKDKGEFVSISVKDTGLGIPEDKKRLIFERFEQVDSTLTRKREGSGIGLSLVKSIVEFHGGWITVDSELGKGSEFIFVLPAKPSNGMIINNEVEAIKEVNIDRLSIEFSDIYS